MSEVPAPPFHTQTVLVTGASRGIGAAIAERFAAAGLNIVIHYKASHEAANETARKCLSHKVKVLTIACDIRSREQVYKMRDKLWEFQLFPDILVNNAGISHYGMLADATDDDWDQVMETNLKSAFLCSQTFMEHMVQQKYGRIINISSIWGETGTSCEVLYSASKGGLNAFTKALAKELAPSGITVNAVAPGVIETAMILPFSQDERSAMANDIPMGRFGLPEEVASLVYFLALPESGYLTGQIISPNGGWQT